MPRLGSTDLDVFGLCLGTKAFGWTADEDASFAVLDAYAAAGGNFLDTADLYSGGASEEIVGRWMASRAIATLADLCARRGLSCLPYYGLARGFLTGKYRPDGDVVDSPRAEGAARYRDARGERVLAALYEAAAAHETAVATVALAWLAAQPTVAAPIASARTPEQLSDLLGVAELRLGEDELAGLSAASER